jgi:hypothetical protein
MPQAGYNQEVLVRMSRAVVGAFSLTPSFTQKCATHSGFISRVNLVVFEKNSAAKPLLMACGRLTVFTKPDPKLGSIT